MTQQNNQLQKMNRGAIDKIKQLVEQNYKLENKLPIYIPKKYDKIDLALATFINFKYPEREQMKILFLRESEGVYSFGKKRVHMKVEKGDQPQVRVGGGFIHVQDFIDTYTTEEVNKIKRRTRYDVANRFKNTL